MTRSDSSWRALQQGSGMVPDKAIDLVDELLRDLHLRELNLEELANRIERSCNFTLGLMLRNSRRSVACDNC